MGWFRKFLTSSIGQKVIMSLTGVFLIVFLVIHLVGNLQLLYYDEGKAFNMYAKFMTTFGPIKLISYLLYASILLHAVQGWLLWAKNRMARGAQDYAVKKVRAVKTNGFIASKMGWLGTIIFVFILIHLYQFWFQMKLGALTEVTYDDQAYANLYQPVYTAFTNIWFVLFYIASMVIIGMHLWHGFHSSFQTLGLNHKKYSPFIRFLGRAYSVIIPTGFAIIPIVFYLKFGIA